MDIELELKHRSEISDAKLGVAEDLGYLLAGLLAALVHQQWDNWLYTFITAIASYIACIYSYRKSALQAEDDYLKTARLGKYSRQQESDVA